MSRRGPTTLSVAAIPGNPETDAMGQSRTHALQRESANYQFQALAVTNLICKSSVRKRITRLPYG
jgi:hypothetical protein